MPTQAPVPLTSDFVFKYALGVNILDFRLFPEALEAPMHAAFRAYCKDAPQLAPLTDFIIHFIELPQFSGRNVMPSTAFGKRMYSIAPARTGTLGSLLPHSTTGCLISRVAEFGDCVRYCYSYRPISDNHRAGRLSLRDVATRLNRSLGDTLESLQHLGISGNAGADDILSSLTSLGVWPARRTYLTGVSARSSL